VPTTCAIAGSAILVVVTACARPQAEVRRVTTDVPRSLRLEIRIVGNGSVVLPSGDKCRDRCSIDIAPATSVGLAARPDETSTFVEWSGGCSGSSLQCTSTVPSTVVARFDSAATRPAWIQQLDILGHGVGNGIVVDKDNASVVVSTVYSPVSWGKTALVPAGRGDVLVGSMSSDGDKRWAIIVGSANDDMASDVAVGNNGEVFVAIFMGGSATVDGQIIPGPGVFVLRFRGGDGRLRSFQQLSGGDVQWPVRIATEGKALFALGSPKTGSSGVRLWKTEQDASKTLWVRDYTVGHVSSNGLNLQLATSSDKVFVMGGHEGYNELEIVALGSDNGDVVWRRATHCSLGCSVSRLRATDEHVCAGGAFGGRFRHVGDGGPGVAVKPPATAGFVGCWDVDGNATSLDRTDVALSDFIDVASNRFIAGVDLVSNRWTAVFCRVDARGSCKWRTHFRYSRAIKAPFRIVSCRDDRVCVMGTFIGALGVGGLVSKQNGDVFVAAFDLR